MFFFFDAIPQEDIAQKKYMKEQLFNHIRPHDTATQQKHILSTIHHPSSNGGICMFAYFQQQLISSLSSYNMFLMAFVLLHSYLKVGYSHGA